MSLLCDYSSNWFCSLEKKPQQQQQTPPYAVYNEGGLIHCIFKGLFPTICQSAKCQNIYLRPCSRYFRNKVIEKITQCRTSKSYSLFTIKLLYLKIILEIWWNWHCRVRVSALILFAENLFVVTTSTLSFKSIFVIIFHACYNAYMSIQASEYQFLRMTQSAQVGMHGTSSMVAIVTSDNHRLLCDQNMSAGKVSLVLQMFTFLQPKWLGGEDLNCESCSCNAVSGKTK